MVPLLCFGALGRRSTSVVRPSCSPFLPNHTAALHPHIPSQTKPKHHLRNAKAMLRISSRSAIRRALWNCRTDLVCLPNSNGGLALNRLPLTLASRWGSNKRQRKKKSKKSNQPEQVQHRSQAGDRSRFYKSKKANGAEQAQLVFKNGGLSTIKNAQNGKRAKQVQQRPQGGDRPRTKKSQRVNDFSKFFLDPVGAHQPASAPALTFPGVDEKIQERRRKAAEAINFLLDGHPTWRGQIFDILRESCEQETRPIKKNALLKDLQQWYSSSLPSFCQRLTEGNYPAHFEYVVDTLADEKLSSPEFLQAYRAMPGYRYRVAKLSSDILTKEHEHQKNREDGIKLQEEIEQMQKSVDGFLDGILDEPDSSPKKTNAGWEGFEAFVDFFTSGSSAKGKKKAAAQKLTREEARRRAMKTMRTLETKRSLLAQCLMAERSAAAKIEEATKRRMELLPPMSDDEYQEATKKFESLRDDICRFLADHILERYRVILERFQILDNNTDLTRPHEWFPRARLDRRKIIFHAGPTNSGKTYNALKRLKEAKTGVYLGPLRLLAAEVYENLTAEGIYCNLLTGQEKREVPFATHSAATIEMASIDNDFDVVVIDEIQMIQDIERGYAWTRALMGMRCKEIHVCGGAETEAILRKLAAACGDDFEMFTYKRFSTLTVAKRSLAKSIDQEDAYRNVEKGDCIVAFSRDDIFAIKREIEKLTDFKCCIVYGSLPPQTRSEQARLFNDPDSGYDILVASDAIGMGLNLNIRRIIFNSIYKNDGTGIVRLDHSAVKQISGRAGRRNSVFPEGIVTCRVPQDMTHLRACMATEIKPIERAGLLPTASHFESFDLAMKTYSEEDTKSRMYTILRQFGEMASVRNDYFLCRQSEMYDIAKQIDQYPLRIKDKYTLVMCPVNIGKGQSMEILTRFAEKYSIGGVSGLPNRTIPRKPRNLEELSTLCNIFSDVDLFLWLQNKFPPGNCIEQQNALAIRDTTIQLIGEALASNLRHTHSYINRDKRVRELWKRRQRKLKLLEAPEEEEEEEEEDKDIDDIVEEEWEGEWNVVAASSA